ncbi:MAG TPA: POTRA domain-containing protein [Candidatus Acidoferrum sp.]|nr:POTRA domain-containing protein [Candidatus Acidoferrum sp.]
MKKGGVTLFGRIVAFALLLGATATRAQRPPEAPAVNGAALPPTIVAVRIAREDGQVLVGAPSGVAVEAGQPLDRKKVAESLRALYRTGDYADLKAVVTPELGGVRVEFVARENLFFNEVRIEGLVAPPTDPSAAAAMQLGLGQTYREATVSEAVERLKETLREEGLYLAEVWAEKVPHPERHQMDIVAHVKPGPRARVGVIRMKNDTEYRDSEILSRSKISVGRQVTSARLQRGIERIRKYLVKKGHLSARAAVRRGAYDAAKNTIPLDLDVTEGPKVQVTVAGAKFSKGELKKLIPIYQEGAVDADLLEEGKRNLRERLEREGHFDAEVNYATGTHDVKPNGSGWKGTEEVITYTVERGARHKLIGIEITGNRYFDTELLRSRLQIFGGAFASRGRFSRRLVESDTQSMRNLYQANGFLDARVDSQIEDNYKGKEGALFIHFRIQEGKQTLVASLSIEGNHAFKEEDLLSVIGSTPGQPYSDFGVTTDRDNILALYFNEGFPEARFTATGERVSADPAAAKAGAGKSGRTVQEPDRKVESDKELKPAIEQAEAVRLVYRIQEGPQTHVRQIFTGGYKHTRLGVINREVRIKMREPLREGEVVESQRQLYNLGVFNRVTIEPQNPNGTDPQKDIALLVEEAKRYTVAYGGGFEVQRLASTTSPTGGQIQAAPRGIIELSKLNLTGRADSLSFKLRGSTLQGRALLGYSVPNTFGNPHFSFQATAFAEKTRDINTFTQERYEGSVQLTDQVTPLTTVLYRYAFRQVRVSNLQILSQEIPLFNQPTLVSQFGVTWFRDSRDNPADAARGSFNSADFSDADTTFGSSASFLRFFLQNSTYYPIKRRFSFARSSRFGLLLPYRDTISLSFPDPKPGQCTTSTPAVGPSPTLIPLPERFFAGGGTSLRGFALNQAGPRDACTGFPVGGQAMLVLNQEFRFPMRLPYVGTSLGGAIFYDGGNVYSRLTRISFRATLPTPVMALGNPALPPGPTNLPECIANCTNELNYFAHTIGFGVRYKTPVGPIRVDLGYQINRPSLVIPIPCPSNAPSCQLGSLGQQSTRLPGFQIFFNLGSTF